jgi:hypothetical protein
MTFTTTAIGTCLQGKSARRNFMFDIIPDIHGQAAQARRASRAELGWRRTAAGWANDQPGREIVFLGDFIDRGPENAA